MHLRTLFLKDFRIYTEKRFELSPGINVIYGANARGKTSVLEAVYLLMTGRSFRTTQMRDLIRHGASAFYIEAVFEKHGIEQSLKMTFDGRDRKVFYNHTSCPTLSGLLGLLQGTVMVPDDVELVKGSPRFRRRFLDLQLAQADPLYVHHLTRYYRAMRQRNHLLRTHNVTTIETWEQEMAKAAAYLVVQRNQVVKDLQGTSCMVLAELSDAQEEMSLSHKNPAPQCESDISAFYCEQYHRMRNRELQLGNTLVGPHKDDLQILLKGKDARYFASEGQQRCCVSALRFAEWERLKHHSEESPMMLIDDVGISMDRVRRKKMLSLVQKTLTQALLTATEKIDVEQAQYTQLT